VARAPKVIDKFDVVVLCKSVMLFVSAGTSVVPMLSILQTYIAKVGIYMCDHLMHTSYYSN